jgi:hypothetical protein
MENQKEKLVKVSTYARMINKSPVWVYKLIESNNLKSVEIDGVKFIILER